MSNEAVTLTLRSEGSHPQPFEIRLRQALKILLRAFGLRAIDIRPTNDPKPPAIPAGEPK